MDCLILLKIIKLFNLVINGFDIYYFEIVHKSTLINEKPFA